MSSSETPDSDANSAADASHRWVPSTPTPEMIAACVAQEGRTTWSYADTWAAMLQAVPACSRPVHAPAGVPGCVLDLAREALYEMEALGGLLVRESMNDSTEMQFIVRTIGRQLINLYTPINLALCIEDVDKERLREARHAIYAHHYPDTPEGKGDAA